ncbi:SDR family NAD(P)-dependent oxidoreductase [Arthrobacter bambusae]|uniref:NAD(P)-dependent dehydrogenase (Short-subunit alcohol dehydrogenase family) n=1 Tax=Arthrobacter bambusae TaxID=1338426 RepID=A0AAW8DG06_9MICC|nr:SDR family oxidoreductase [Arthrobacter bambusae]MDP9904842.1 NAD(P)-dependent dehydrogenase (short-subunit alcohol dehydrogenase family) [Arthrobacter bambusae]MDQ0129658.1 NAD(P)-dependent dehydrogenase (short-subunit alcohol dehydrogenase family) [Arthrobacter bambusae]MDQ0180729.1 NAD(P)-dependent dehydrogenase (short-subunit alcohol dehydrogenase family) [Arthrobacter bambusae]
MSKRLDGKTALVTGAGSGIGLAVAQRFVAEGARVYFADINLEAAEKAAAVTGSALAQALRMDISDEASVIAAYAAVAEDGPLDVVVANAGVQLFGQDARVGDLDLAVWEKTVSINQRGAFLTLKHAVRAMEGRGGSIICTGSPTAVVACGQTFTAYTSSKAGVHGLARVVAADYAAAGIRVNTVVPGYTETPLVQTIADDPVSRAGLVNSTMLGRPGTAADVEGIMVFLASDESAYATGGLFTVDGGLTAL